MSKVEALFAPASARLRQAALLTAAAASAVVACQGSALVGTLGALIAQAPGGVHIALPAIPLDPNAVQPFFLKANALERERATRCMTDAIYYEAANEPVEGQRAVAQVILNRVHDTHFPKSVCGVVYQGWERKTGCQFSFVCDGSILRRHASAEGWTRLRPVAVAALSGYVHREVGTSTHYYATYVRPNWVRSVAEVADIGRHVFCSWKGKAGMPSALTGAYLGGEFAIAEAVLDGLHGPKAAKELRRQGMA